MVKPPFKLITHFLFSLVYVYHNLTFSATRINHDLFYKINLFKWFSFFKRKISPLGFIAAL